MVALWAGTAAVAVWLYLLFARGGFWRVEKVPELSPALLANPPRIVAVVPARNEAAVVARSLASLAAQQYPGGFHIVLVDDSSTDGTAPAARSAASPEVLTVIPAPPLRSGWTGKLSAVSEGIRYAARFRPDYFLLTDADILHPPDNLAVLAARAEIDGYDLTSFMVTLECRTSAERTLIPAFVFFFFLLYPPAWIRNPRRATAGAAGGCMLIRRSTLESIGGIDAIRGELIDDCALARAVKRSGGTVWLGLSARAHSIRPYATFGELGSMISRSAFTQLHHSVLLLAGTVLGLSLTYLSPPVLALAASGAARALGIAAWLLMAAAYLPMLRFYRRSPLWAPALPLVAAFYLGATLHSAFACWTGAGGMWKGRVQDAVSSSKVKV